MFALPWKPLLPHPLLVSLCLLAAAHATAQRTIPIKFPMPTYGDKEPLIQAWNAGLGKPFDIVGDAPLADNFDDWKPIKAGQFAWTTPSFAQAEKDASRAPKTVKWYFYDFEHWEHTPKAEQDDVVGTSRRIRAFTTTRGWKAGIAPMYRDGPKLAASLAPFYDAYIVQCQKGQSDERRAETVVMLREVSKTIHAINPKCLVGCQLGMSDTYGDGTPGSGLKTALKTYEATKDFSQIYGVWWPPNGKAMVSFLQAIDQPTSGARALLSHL